MVPAAPYLPKEIVAQDCCSPPPMSLGDGTAAFQAWGGSELPEEWSRPCDRSDLRRAGRDLDVPSTAVFTQVVLELPDFTWAWRYQEWHRQLSDQDSASQTPVHDQVVPIMLVDKGDFRKAEPAERE